MQKKELSVFRRFLDIDLRPKGLIFFPSAFPKHKLSKYSDSNLQEFLQPCREVSIVVLVTFGFILSKGFCNVKHSIQAKQWWDCNNWMTLSDDPISSTVKSLGITLNEILPSNNVYRATLSISELNALYRSAPMNMHRWRNWDRDDFFNDWSSTLLLQLIFTILIYSTQ